MGSGTELGRVRGLGSSNEGAHHWWHQRLTAGGNLVLMLWLFASLARLPQHDYATMQLWLSSPLAAIPMILLVASTFYHFRMGLQVLIEDYAHGAMRAALMVLLTFFTLGAATIAIFSILKIAFAAGAPIA
ncbi:MULTISPECIES: succinate dehydrogenase, hydrophobic membrane anchor protein [unclassified Sphingomonas]|uniref:succinate dehydrogenase, hydrophobic membrane anchor protein n=1 Tax=unclassified Sphingomonas TaxID=196159 RepID=UPI000BC434A4|nr:MAG: succinate dehydrogenase, hydrophobic membrane anchor protein [Sphingomonas sp. 12-62-6]OYX37637.1 MAG: succinate dehydrogenase, hydrophobic membrane anchor protein [Sphingomonas sp. 32-62-10]OYY64508.1 MAG: succinate dehydrogenase, hydrophobic membrane anchor protein [Sphingomonas sp. 28-62-11]